MLNPVTDSSKKKGVCQAMKSEVLVKATAELAQEVIDKDLTAKQKNMEEILNEAAGNNDRGRIHGGVSKGSGTDKKKI